MLNYIDDLTRELRGDYSNGSPIEPDSHATDITQRNVREYLCAGMTLAAFTSEWGEPIELQVYHGRMASGLWQRLCHAMLSEVRRELGGLASAEMTDALDTVQSYLVASNFGLTNIPW